MRAAPLIVQALVLLGIAALVALLARQDAARPVSLTPRPASEAALESASDLAPRAEEPRVSRRFVAVVDRETGEPATGVPLLRLPVGRGTEPVELGRTDVAGVVPVTVVGEERVFVAVCLPGRVSRPLVIGHGPSDRARPKVLHVARAGLVQGRLRANSIRGVMPTTFEVVLELPLRDTPRGPAGRAPADAGAPPSDVVVLRAPVGLDGEFTLPQVPVELDGLRLRAEATRTGERWGELRLPPFAVGEARRVELDVAPPDDPEHSATRRLAAEFAVAPGARVLEGEYRSPDGLPLANVALTVVSGALSRRRFHGCDGPLPAAVRTTRTDPWGRFRFDELGEHFVYVGRKYRDARGLHVLERVELAGARIEVVLQDPPVVWVEGEASFVGGAGVDVWLSAATPDARRGVNLRDQGRFRLGPFLPRSLGAEPVFEARTLGDSDTPLEVAVSGPTTGETPWYTVTLRRPRPVAAASPMPASGGSPR